MKQEECRIMSHFYLGKVKWQGEQSANCMWRFDVWSFRRDLLDFENNIGFLFLFSDAVGTGCQRQRNIEKRSTFRCVQ